MENDKGELVSFINQYQIWKRGDNDIDIEEQRI